MYKDVIKANEALDRLIKVANTGIMSDVGELIDSLDEHTCKLMLRIITYGGYKKFMIEK